MRKFLSLLLIAVLALTMVSCGGVTRLRPDRSHSFTYKAPGGSAVCSFTADEAGEYTVRHETEAADVVCTVYADEALTVPVGHPSAPGAFCFSLPLEKEQTVYLELTYETEERVKGSLTVSRYQNTDETDVNYGHPTSIALTSSKQVDGRKDGTHVFSFTATGPAAYTFLCSGSTPAAVSFYTDPWCTEEILPVNNTSYPDEHYQVSDENIFCNARSMAKDETVYFTVTPLADGEADTVTVSAGMTVPDPVSAEERFRYLTANYHPYVLICSDPAAKFGTGVGKQYVSNFATPVTSYMSEEVCGNGKSVYDYINSSELRMLEDGYYVIYSVSDMQSGIDNLWGGGRIDANAFSEGYTGEYGSFSLKSISTAKGYFFNQEGFGDDGLVDYYDVLSVKAYDKYTVVTVAGVVYNAHNYELYDASGYLGEKKRIGTGLKKRDTVSAYLEVLEMSEDQLGAMDFVFFSGRNGLKLWGVFPAGEATVPAVSTSAVALPSVIPDAFLPEYRMKVASSGGLRLRSGPGTDYESFAILPNETLIRCYAQQDEWIYICYMGRYGWVAAEYCTEP